MYVHKSPTLVGAEIALIIISLCVITITKIPLIISLLVLAFTIYFFRGWRKPSNFTKKDNVLYCPCDGVIKAIHETHEHVHIVIFLNIHNIHVQYAPFDCVVKDMRYQHGTFHPAYLLTKSEHNERQDYTLTNAYFGDVSFSQIAGQVARRIQPFVKVGDEIEALSPIGMIKFGSRCDLKLNKKYNIRVVKNVGDRVHIGDTLVTYHL